MARYKRFTFLCDTEERRTLAVLAERLQRSQSDSVRWLIREAARELQAAVHEGRKATRADGKLDSELAGIHAR